jgi:hypothetical protein
MAKLTRAALGVDAFDNQKDYLKETPKPEKMSVYQLLPSTNGSGSPRLLQKRTHC